MPRPLRFLPEECSLIEVTCRTVHARHLMNPSHEANDLIIGVIGRAQRMYSMRICAVVFMHNHYHLLLDIDDCQQLAKFMGHLNSNIARELGRLADWREKFWSRRYQAIVVSDELEAQEGRLEYLLSHGVKEGLVSRPQQWPGVNSVSALQNGVPLTGHWFDRSQEYEARRQGKDPGPREFAIAERVIFSPIPAWSQLSASKIQRRIRALISQIECIYQPEEDDSRATLRLRPPHFRPETAKRLPAPRFHTATRARFSVLTDAYSAFLDKYRSAVDELRSAKPQISFPSGCFPPALPFSQ